MGTGPITSYKKCYMCDKYATWVNDEEEKGYCERHFPGRICECDICKSYENK